MFLVKLRYDLLSCETWEIKNAPIDFFLKLCEIKSRHDTLPGPSKVNE